MVRAGELAVRLLQLLRVCAARHPEDLVVVLRGAKSVSGCAHLMRACAIFPHTCSALTTCLVRCLCCLSPEDALPSASGAQLPTTPL